VNNRREAMNPLREGGRERREEAAERKKRKPRRKTRQKRRIRRGEEVSEVIIGSFGTRLAAWKSASSHCLWFARKVS